MYMKYLLRFKLYQNHNLYTKYKPIDFFYV